jgi:hypothetical protein
MAAASEVPTTLIERFDPSAFDAPSGRARLRFVVDEVGDWDFVTEGREPQARAGGAAPGTRVQARGAAAA